MRYEYKYLVSYDDLESIRQMLAPYVECDQYTSIRKNKEYTVRSIYFDNAKLSCYYEKLAGLQSRKKLRIRGYNELQESTRVFLEIKRKYNAFVFKDRATVGFDHLSDLFSTKDIKRYVIQGSTSADIENAQKFFYNLVRGSLLPVILVVYEREAFFSKFNKTLRITFDKNLRSAIWPPLENLFSEQGLVPATRQHFIFEVKFYGGLPSWMTQVLKTFNAQRLAFSKYTICLDSQQIKNHYNWFVPLGNSSSTLSFRVPRSRIGVNLS